MKASVQILQAVSEQRALQRKNAEASLPEGSMNVRGLKGGGPVLRTPEVDRILALPRRSHDHEEAEWFAQELTRALKTPEGKMTLRPVQAAAFRELDENRSGLFCPARVGAGKTIISLLAPAIVEAKRPLLLVPAKLLHKTQREARELRKHWPIPTNIFVETYEKVSRVTGADMLEAYQPDCIVGDEIHKLKNPKAAVTRRVRRYMEQHPDTIFIALSGTITKRSIMDYAHILKWTHKDGRPVPRTYTEVEEWCLALDEKIPPGRRKAVGALSLFFNEEEMAYFRSEPIGAARRAYQRRLVDTAGVVSTKETFGGASIQLQRLDLEMVPEIVNCFHMLRHDWLRPDNVDLSDPVEIYRHARQLALGFYYRWNPAAPEDWLEARRDWGKFVRQTLAHNRQNLDSELQVANAVDRGIIDGQDVLARWRETKPSFTPNTECVWVSNVAIQAAWDWMKKTNGIVWVEHVEFGKRLERVTGVPYYGREGKTDTGRIIEDHPPGKPLIASIQSNSEGRNLQAWCENLITSAPPNNLQWEQLLGRTHREGQMSDEVGVDVFLGCFEHLKAFHQACADARYMQDTLGQPQKLLYADVDMPTFEELKREFMSDPSVDDCRMHDNDYSHAK